MKKILTEAERMRELMNVSEGITPDVQETRYQTKSRAPRNRDLSFGDSGTVAKMDDEVYALRRKVIDIIHMARKIDPKMPRISVRIGDVSKDMAHRGVLAFAYVKKDTLFMDANTFTKDNINLKFVVFHELAHAIYGVRHDSRRELMGAVYKDVPDSTITNDYKFWADLYYAGDIASNGYTEDAKFYKWD